MRRLRAARVGWSTISDRRAGMLKDKLEAIRAMARRLPEDAQALMQRSIDDLRASGILGRVVKIGERAPAFTLPSIDGVPVSLTDLLAKGPVVLSFFRGRW